MTLQFDEFFDKNSKIFFCTCERGRAPYALKRACLKTWGKGQRRSGSEADSWHQIELVLSLDFTMATPEKLFVSETFEMSTDNPGTDSYGSKSDHSGKFLHRPRMDVVVVIDLNHHSGLCDRKKAFEEVKITCASMNNVAVHQIQVSCKKCTTCATWHHISGFQCYAFENHQNSIVLFY